MPERGLHTGSEAARARAMIYYALAEALAGPACTEPCPERSRRGSPSIPGIEGLLLDAATTGAQILSSSACQKTALTLAELPAPDLEALRKSYSCLIAGPGRRPMALYESLHRQGCLMGPATWDVERYYKALGLMPANGELPDHASVELAFLGHLAEAEAEAREAGNGRLVARLRGEQRYFLRAHAGAWLPEMGATLAAADELFYAAVGHLLSGFLAEELSGRKRNGPAGARLPALEDPAHCTLCGLCVGSCPPGALRVIESATETALTLNPGRCIGCDRCVRICPEGVLSLSCGGRARSETRAANGTGHRVLRQSPRARCSGCGRPTVSRAELDAVFARLQPEPAMQQLLGLCVECKSWNM